MTIKILADASLPQLKKYFPEPFSLSYYHTQTDLLAQIEDKNILLCRSTLNIDDKLLLRSGLSYIATASSGIDHIDTNFLAQRKIELIDAKGCNAHAVADYVLSSISYLQSMYLLQGKRVGIIGAGKVGCLSAERLINLGFQTILYDPPRALRDKSFITANREELYSCDLICIHANFHLEAPHATKHLINQHFLSQLKPGTIILNAARGGIVDESAILQFSSRIKYCVDVYAHEPDINPEVIAMATLCTPHIAGHSIEAKINAIKFISAQLHYAYDLIPPVPIIVQNTAPFSMPANWNAWALSLYNPLEETRALKNASNNLKNVFLTLRQAHQCRHDFQPTAP